MAKMEKPDRDDLFHPPDISIQIFLDIFSHIKSSLSISAMYESFFTKSKE